MNKNIIPKLSVIVPVYNTEKYLKRCIESILNQTLIEIEIIVVNDGSTDKSLDILKNYQELDSRIIIIDKENGGVSSARNEALKIATAEYCLNIDSDDWIEKNYCEELYFRAKKDDLDIVISDFYDDWDNGKMKYSKQLELKDSELITPENYLKIIFTGETNVYTWNKIFKRKLYVENNILYDTNITYSEDAIVLIQLILYSEKIGKINKAMYHYIKSDTSINKNMKLKQYKDLIRSFDIMQSILERKNKNIDVKFREINILSKLFIQKINFKENEYNQIIEKYIDLIKSQKNIDKFSIKLKVYFKIIRLFPYKMTFLLLNKFNRLMSIVKRKVLKYE